MRKTLIAVALMLALLLTSCASLSQTSADIGTLQEVIEVAEATEDELYTKARSWFVEAFNSAEAVIQQEDKTSHIIKGKYTDSVQRNSMCEVVYESIITVETQEGRVRCTISAPINTYTRVGYNTMSADRYTVNEVENINIQRQTLCESLKAYLQAEYIEW